MKKNSIERTNTIKDRVNAAMISAYVALMPYQSMIAFAAKNTKSAGNKTADAGGAITQGILGGTEKIWSILVAVVGPIAAVALAICAVKMLWGNQKAAEDAKSTAIRIIIAIGIVLLAPALITAVTTWFKEQSAWSFGSFVMTPFMFG